MVQAERDKVMYGGSHRNGEGKVGVTNRYGEEGKTGMEDRQECDRIVNYGEVFEEG
jgi:hypothetical protein